MKKTLLPAALALALSFSTTPLFSASPGVDNADSPAYQKSPAWSGGENGGSGFVGWNLVGKGEPLNDRGFFLGDSRPINSDINSPSGQAFGMFAKGKGNSVEAYRTFEEPLEVGQTFSVDMAVNFRSGLKGIDLRTPSSDGERVVFNLNIGGDDYVVNKAATGNGSLGATYDQKTAFKVSFKQTSPSGGEWTVVRTGGISSTATGTYEGVAAGVKFYVRDTDGGKENDLWINNLAISGPTAP